MLTCCNESDIVFHNCMKKLIIKLVIVFVSMIAATYLSTRIWVYFDAKKVAKQAVEVYQKDVTTSMIEQLKCDTVSLSSKNRVIWAIGIVGNTTALPYLKTLLTGQECDHEKYVCQKELLKAIDKLQ